MRFSIKQFFSKFGILWVFVGIGTFVLLSCSEDSLSDESFTIGSDLVETHTQLGFVDTLSVDLSTVILDSVPTSGTGRMLVGQYADGEFGNINATSCFQVDITSAAFDDKSVYDSLVLILSYDGYYYGDTTKEQTIQVYPLLEEPEENDDGYLYNTSNIYASDEIIGSLTLKPRISKESIEIRLSDSLGYELFDRLLNEEITSSSDFLDEYPGLALKTISEDGAIMGYSIEDSSSYMVLHYHKKLAEKHEYTAEFPPVNTDLQFNHIETDRTGTVLESWTEQRYDISTDLTNDKVYVQGATGVLTRVEFPSLNYFVEIGGDNGSLLKAELTFIPVKDTYDEFDIPSNTVLYQTDKKSVMYSAIYSTDGETVQNGNTNVDLQYHENTYISFDLTAYFVYDFLDNYYDEKQGFLLGLDAPDYYSSFDRTIIGGLNNPNYTPKLLVYYILYQN